MQYIKDALRERGWDMGTCLWQMKDKDRTLECYLIQNETQMKAVIIQKLVNQPFATIFSSDTDLLR